ncbi:fibronectin type III domain-containing protein [Algoriphagus ornithinivorans]|nr:hypothetical protein [Algoriphagus ornithinivorans]
MALAGIMPSNSFGQCTVCGTPRVYSGAGTTLNTSTNSGSGSLHSSRWTGGTGNFLANQIAEFNRNLAFTWQASSFTLRGLVVSNGARLTLDRPNNGENSAFNIENGCIVVRAGSQLNLVYFNIMENVTICIEDGGSINFDSRSTSGDRDKFVFDNVVITLQGPNATLNFGDADIDIVGPNGLEIIGWTGNDVCNGTTPPASNTSGNITWSNGTLDICDLLNLRVLPIDLAYFTVAKNTDSRISMLRWATLKEWENSHFEIERSFNSIQEWASIGSVSGQGYSDGEVEYEFVDWSLPVSAGNIYYRIKQVDFDGTFSYSPVKAVQIDAIPGKDPWILYPNPSLLQEEVKIEWREPQDWKEEQVILRISNSKGFGTSLFLRNISEVQEVVKSYFNDQPAGLYLIDLSWADKNQQFKVLRK